MTNERPVCRDAARPFWITVAPLQMKTMLELCAMYGKTRTTIRKWREEGAPINFDGVNYSADYHLLEAWRLNRFANFEDE